MLTVFVFVVFVVCLFLFVFVVYRVRNLCCSKLLFEKKVLFTAFVVRRMCSKIVFEIVGRNCWSEIVGRKLLFEIVVRNQTCSKNAH